MSFIKHHWFGFLTSLFVLWVLAVFILVLFSPRQDVQGRGFIPCTETMADEMLVCEKNKALCMLKAIVKNSICDMNVVAKGFGAWVVREQSTPWSNYLFESEIPEDDDFDNAAKAEYLKNNPAMEAEMSELKQLNEEIENEQMQQQQELLQQEQPK